MADETLSAAYDERPFAVLDVGSNSARMIVFRLRDGEHLDVIEDARAPLRLARELHTGAELGPEAIERTLEALGISARWRKGQVPIGSSRSPHRPSVTRSTGTSCSSARGS